MEHSSQRSRNWLQEYRSYIDKITRLTQLAEINYQRASRHPIYKHLSQLKKQLDGIVTPHGLHFGKYPNSPEEIIRINRNLIESTSVYGNDRMYWLADGYFEQLEKSPSLRKFIQTRLPKPELFQAVIAELQQWGYLKARMLEPSLVQEEGLPDLEFGAQEVGGPFFFDVKTICKTSSPASIRKHIKKGNKQIKAAGDNVPGGCYIHISPILVGGYPKGVPKELEAYSNEINKVLNSNSCRSVARVVLTWQEVSVKGNIPGWQTWVVARKSHIFKHKNPRVSFSIASDYSFKSTCATNIRIGEDHDPPIWDIDTIKGEIIASGR